MDADAGESLLLNVSDDLEEMDIDISEGENYMDGMMGEIHEQMDRLMKDQRGRGPETAFEMWQAFTSAINWSERWIQALLAFHVTLFVVAVVLRNNENAQMSIFLTVCILVYFCESVNTYCALHWREFSTQNYFDERGVFASVMYAAPLLVIGLLQLINFLRLTSSLLIKSKRMQLRQQVQQQKQKTGIDCDADGNKEEISSSEVKKTK